MTYDINNIKVGDILVNTPYEEYFYVFDVDVESNKPLMHGVSLRSGNLFNYKYDGWIVRDKASDEQVEKFYNFLKDNNIVVDMNLKKIRIGFNFNT